MQAYIVMDYMMKWMPMKYAESTRDFFAKKGRSVHGVAVYFLSSSGERMVLYYLSIVENRSKQDMHAVCCHFESAVQRLKLDLPHITEVCSFLQPPYYKTY